MAESGDKKGGLGSSGFGPEDRTIVKSQDSVEEATPIRPQYKPPYVVVVEGPRTGAHFPLGDGPNIIGRALGAAIRLEDQSVSRHHAELTKGVGGWMVKDLGSKNGTSVNGAPITEAVVLGHKDIIKTGIYLVRLITQNVTLEEELTLPQNIVTADRTIFVEAPHDHLTSKVEGREHIEIEPEQESAEPSPATPHTDPQVVQEIAESSLRKKFAANKRAMVLGSILIAVIMVGGFYFAAPIFFGGEEIVVKKGNRHRGADTVQGEDGGVVDGADGTEVTGDGSAAGDVAQQGTPQGDLAMLPDGQPPQGVDPNQQIPPPDGSIPNQLPPTNDIAQVQQQAGQVPEQVGQLQQQAVGGPTQVQQLVPKVPVFVDFASSPLPGRITFLGNEVGTTPKRVNLELEQGKVYQGQAVFEMPEIQDRYTQTIDISVEKGATIVPVLFRAPIGMMKVVDLPRDVEMWLVGKYSYDKFNEHAVKMKEIVLGKPFYVPYGDYSLELRRTRKLGQTAETYVQDIIYKRTFQIAEENPAYTLQVKDDDLKIFPVIIRSDPENAFVYIDDVKVGKTPFEGSFPLGEHKMVLRKEGYFEHSEQLKVDINTPYLGNVILKTSVAGARINNAKAAINRGMFKEAIGELAEALNNKPAVSEVGIVNYLLGQCYMNLNDMARAIGYFEQAKGDEDQRYRAMLGLVAAYASQGNNDSALPLLVEVMMRGKDGGLEEDVKRESTTLFQKLSPFRSIIYIYTEPTDATVTFNDKVLQQKTPMILPDLSLGTQRIKVEKLGYLPTELNVTLSVNEFNPIIVRMKPIPK